YGRATRRRNLLSRQKTLDQSIDRSLDNFGTFLRRKWWLLALIALIVWYVYDPTSVPVLGAVAPMTMFGILLQVGLAVTFGIMQFVAIFWFLGRPRLYWGCPARPGRA